MQLDIGSTYRVSNSHEHCVRPCVRGCERFGKGSGRESGNPVVLWAAIAYGLSSSKLRAGTSEAGEGAISGLHSTQYYLAINPTTGRTVSCVTEALPDGVYRVGEVRWKHP